MMARWAIEVFFRWIKQHLNIPTLFGTTENTVFNQLDAALLAYVVFKTLHEERRHHPLIQGTSFIRFTRQLLEAELRVEWQLIFQSFIKSYKQLYKRGLTETG
ncbi:hypothetical protein JQN58_12300 [Aneurinibacillus sp. BA2021]|nr:hypothetical protein [Aneurinibacillus sp. BA2021]